MGRRMLRWTVPIDDKWHEFPIDSAIVMAEAIVDLMVPGGHVNVWAEEAAYPGAKMWLRVFGTGHELPAGARHVASAPRHTSGLVFHVYRSAGRP